MSASGDSDREYGRLAFVVGCVLALVLAASLLPAISASLGESPLESVIDASLGEGEDGSGGSQPSMGALNPGQSTTVGGLDGSTSQSLRSLGPEIHFTVQSSQPAYWRTGAYGVYTGSGWEQRGDSRPLDQPLAVSGLTGETVSYEVELNRSATSLPTVWQPRTVSLDRPLTVTGSRALTSEEPLDPGTTYTGTSVRKAREPGVLATAGTDYPASIADRYTALPASTPDRLEAFTDELTADADSPYETARQIESWLEANKTYSLNVTGPDEGHVATSFVFDMEKGYCEYFATAMTAMLRTQGIPARYVVGYSTGQPTGENTYTVRGMNAHAWVEMYVPDVGWVRFDPTPGRERLNAEQAALERQRPTAPAYDHTEQGSPNETFSPDGERQTVLGMNETVTTRQPRTPDEPDTVTTTVRTPTETPTPEPPTPPDPTPDEEPGETDTPLNITLAERPVPGTTATVRVTRRGSPVEGVTVLFNGESIGRTDATGSVEGTVPYSERLNVTVLPDGGASLAPRAVVPPPDDRQYAVAATNGTNRTRTYRVETNATLSIGGTVATGQTVLVTATIGETPVPNAVVRLDGQAVGRTDERGRYRLALPDQPGNHTLAVERDPVSGERTLRLSALTLSVEPTLPLALPWTDVTVTARMGNETAANVPVFHDGERVGTTGPDGTLSTALPLAGSASFSASRYGQTTAATVDGLWTNLALSVGALAALLGAAVVVVRRRDLDADDVLDRLSDGLSLVVGKLIAAADLLERIGRAALASIRNAAAAVRSYLAGRRSASDLRDLFLDWLRGIGTAVRSEAQSYRSRHSGAVASTDGPVRSEAAVTIREAWETFLRRVSIRQPETKTPGELATHAIERDGLPAEAVRTLRDAFRSVEYGARDPSDRLDAVEEAVTSIEHATRTQGEDGD